MRQVPTVQVQTVEDPVEEIPIVQVQTVEDPVEEIPMEPALIEQVSGRDRAVRVKNTQLGDVFQ